MKPEESQQNLKSIERLFLKELITNEVKNEWDETIGWEEKIKRNDLKMKQMSLYMIFNNLKR